LAVAHAGIPGLHKRPVKRKFLAKLLFTTLCILQNLAFLPFKFFVMCMANDLVPAAAQRQTSADVVRQVMDVDAFDEILRAHAVVEATEDSVVDPQVLGREHRGCPEPVPELRWNGRV
jgi:hypothetical protein